MNMKRRLRILFAAGALIAALTMLSAAPSPLGPLGPPAQQSSAALTVRVRSGTESAMEGVLVSAKREGSNITVTVVSNAAGVYAFPQNRLEPGRYAISVRAAGYV